MKQIILVGIITLASLITLNTANASCVCRCYNGANQPLCTNSYEVPPICTPKVCPITPPSVAPILTPKVPPIGTKTCYPQQILNPYTHRYEWKEICR